MRALVGDGQQQAGPQGGQVVRFAFAAGVTHIISDLVSDAERVAVGVQGAAHLLVLVQTGINRPQSQCHFKGGRGFLAKDFEHLQGGERLGLADPAQLGTLSAAKPALALRRHEQHRRSLPGGNRAGADQAIPFADQQVAHIQGHRQAVFLVQGLFAITRRVVVLDVVVDERGLVETLDGHRDLF